MEISPIFDLDNPTAPKWVNVGLNHSELDALHDVLVMFVGHNPRHGKSGDYIPIGTGFIVGATNKLVVVSAAHIFSWWADQVFPVTRNPVGNLLRERENLKERIARTVKEGYLQAFVQARGASEGSICDIESLSLNADPRDMDIAVLQLSMPSKHGPDDFRVLPIDADPFSFKEIVAMAGFTGGGRGDLPSQNVEFPRGLYEQVLAVRAGRIGEYVRTPDGFRSPMFRVNIPSLPGMSGGPLILWRSKEYLNGVHRTATAVGLISRSRLSAPMLLDHCEEGETWVAPIIDALPRALHSADGRCTLDDAIKRGEIPVFGRIAKKVRWEKDPESGHVSPILDGATVAESESIIKAFW